MQLRAYPSVGTPGILMNTVGHELLAGTEKLDLIAINAARVGEADLKLVERFRGLKRDRAFWRLANSYKYRSAITKAIADQMLDCVASFLVQQINIENGCSLSQDAGIAMVGMPLRPGFNFIRSGGAEFLPAGNMRTFVAGFNGHWRIAERMQLEPFDFRLF
jgi:hypothetical protein